MGDLFETCPRKVRNMEEGKRGSGRREKEGEEEGERGEGREGKEEVVGRWGEEGEEDREDVEWEEEREDKDSRNIGLRPIDMYAFGVAEFKNYVILSNTITYEPQQWIEYFTTEHRLFTIVEKMGNFDEKIKILRLAHPCSAVWTKLSR